MIWAEWLSLCSGGSGWWQSSFNAHVYGVRLANMRVVFVASVRAVEVPCICQSKSAGVKSTVRPRATDLRAHAIDQSDTVAPASDLRCHLRNKSIVVYQKSGRPWHVSCDSAVLSVSTAFPPGRHVCKSWYRKCRGLEGQAEQAWSPSRSEDPSKLCQKENTSAVSAEQTGKHCLLVQTTVQLYDSCSEKLTC